MAAGLFVREDLSLEDWQELAIETVKEDIAFVYVLVELERQDMKKVKLRHALYYMWNIKSVRRRKGLLSTEILGKAKIRRLGYITNKRGWAELDDRSVEMVLADSPEYIYHCGGVLMNICREMEGLVILSNHHGDPRRYRGRPAGFYELLEGREVVGQIVQVLSNSVDAGAVLAFAESSVASWSYRKTLDNAYSLSPFLLRRAVGNLRRGRYITMVPSRNKRGLPTNKQVVLLAGKCMKSLLQRLFYGLFVEKKWGIAYTRAETSDCSPPQMLHLIGGGREKINKIAGNERYSMFADCFLLDKSIVAEGLCRKNGLGELVSLDMDEGIASRIKTGDSNLGQHLSYPYTLVGRDSIAIYPESASYKSQLLLKRYKSDEDFQVREIMQDLEGGLIDPSVFRIGGRYYILGNLASEQNVLRLWSASDEEFSDYTEHKESPIVVGIHGGRNGGRIIEWNRRLYRLAQSMESGYGTGVYLFEINRIDQNIYEEEEVGALSFDGDVHGPHTVDFDGEVICWDYYSHKFSFLAGYRRLASKLVGHLRPKRLQLVSGDNRNL